MNEPTIAVALFYLGLIAVAVLLPAPLIVLSVRRGIVVLWVTCISIALLLILVVVNFMGPRSSMNLADQRIFYNIVGLVVISLAAAGWATNRKRRENPASSFFSLLGTAIKMQIASLIIFVLMPGSC
jgi:hypothetical protein